MFIVIIALHSLAVQVSSVVSNCRMPLAIRACRGMTRSTRSSPIKELEWFRPPSDRLEFWIISETQVSQIMMDRAGVTQRLILPRPTGYELGKGRREACALVSRFENLLLHSAAIVLAARPITTPAHVLDASLSSSYSRGQCIEWPGRWFASRLGLPHARPLRKHDAFGCLAVTPDGISAVITRTRHWI